MNHLKISVVTVSYNAVDTIEETILSVLNQTYDNVEYIIIDGGSKDGTVDIIKKYAKGGSAYSKHKNKISYWISENDSGMYDALYKGFQKVTGDICCYINADDFYYKAAFQTVADFFNNHRDIFWIQGLQVNYKYNEEIISIQLPIVTRREFIQKGVYGRKGLLPFIQQESIFWRKELFQIVNWDFFRNLKLAGDYYLWYSFSKKYDLHIIPSYLGGFRQREGQLSNNLSDYFNEIDGFANTYNFLDKILIKIDSCFYSIFRGGSIYSKIWRGKRIHYFNISQKYFK